MSTTSYPYPFRLFNTNNYYKKKNRDLFSINIKTIFFYALFPFLLLRKLKMFLIFFILQFTIKKLKNSNQYKPKGNRKLGRLQKIEISNKIILIIHLLCFDLSQTYTNKEIKTFLQNITDTSQQQPKHLFLQTQKHSSASMLFFYLQFHKYNLTLPPRDSSG